MSVIRKKPFIENVIGTLDETEVASLISILNNGGDNVNVSLLDGSLEKGEGKTITDTITPVYIELEKNKFYSAILIWNSSYCVVIAYHRFQDLKIFKINATTKTYEVVNEYCDINELRRTVLSVSAGGGSEVEANGEAEATAELSKLTVEGTTYSVVTSDKAVAPNTAITGATKTKITYDAKGLVTGGQDLEASDIPTLTLSKISDAGTAAAKNFTTNVTEDSTDLVTSGAVHTAIDNLPEPMIFKGSVGSGGTVEWANLPSASASNEGFVYKVITANSSGVVCEVGDTIISNGSEWVVIPSGDEPSGTVTNVGISVPTGLSVSGSPITSSGTLAISLASGYAIPQVDANGSIATPLSYITTAPSADNPYGLKIVVLTTDPATKYNGYIYMIKK